MLAAAAGRLVVVVLNIYHMELVLNTQCQFGAIICSIYGLSVSHKHTFDKGKITEFNESLKFIYKM